MKYDIETTNKLVELYKGGQEVEQIAEALQVPQRSVIAKLSSLGVYRRKQYLNKRGEVPVKKEQYIEQIADLLECNIELLESLEKCNKSVLIMILKALHER